jgi:hypothetical protein
MGPVITNFVYKDIENALHYSSYYADILTSYKSDFDSRIHGDGSYWTVEFTIYGSGGRKDKSGNSKGTRYLPESSSENG